MPTKAGLINTITTATTLLTMLLSGCSSANKPAHTLYIAYPIAKQEFARSTKERTEKQINLLNQLFLKTNPNTRVVTVAYKADTMQRQIKEDSKLNLGPDLILGTNGFLKSFYRDSLISAFPNSSQWTQKYVDIIKNFKGVRSFWINSNRLKD